MTKRPAHRIGCALRHCCLLVIALWAFSFTPCSTFAQPPEPPAEANQVVPPAPIETGSPARPVVVRGPCDPDYWIVSTRGAKDLVDCGQAVNCVVYRFDGSQPARVSSVEELTASLQPNVPVCLMVHGSFVTWESALNDSAQTYRWLRESAPERPLQVIFYTWDSDDGGILPHLKVNSLGRRADMNGFYIADLITKISHGTRAVSSALHLMAGGTVEYRSLSAGPQPIRQIRVVFAAAAIDHFWLNPDRRYGLALCPTEAVLNLTNPMDFPLLFYPLRKPISFPAMAITGLTNKDRFRMGENNAKIIDYDVSHLVGFGHIWSHYYHHSEIAAAIRHYVYFDETPSPR